MTINAPTQNPLVHILLHAPHDFEAGENHVGAAQRGCPEGEAAEEAHGILDLFRFVEEAGNEQFNLIGEGQRAHVGIGPVPLAAQHAVEDLHHRIDRMPVIAIGGIVSVDERIDVFVEREKLVVEAQVHDLALDMDQLFADVLVLVQRVQALGRIQLPARLRAQQDIRIAVIRAAGMLGLQHHLGLDAGRRIQHLAAAAEAACARPFLDRAGIDIALDSQRVHQVLFGVIEGDDPVIGRNRGDFQELMVLLIIIIQGDPCLGFRRHIGLAITTGRGEFLRIVAARVVFFDETLDFIDAHEGKAHLEAPYLEEALDGGAGTGLCHYFQAEGLVFTRHQVAGPFLAGLARGYLFRDDGLVQPQFRIPFHRHLIRPVGYGSRDMGIRFHAGGQERQTDGLVVFRGNGQVILSEDDLSGADLEMDMVGIRTFRAGETEGDDAFLGDRSRFRGKDIGRFPARLQARGRGDPEVVVARDGQFCRQGRIGLLFAAGPDPHDLGIDLPGCVAGEQGVAEVLVHAHGIAAGRLLLFFVLFRFFIPGVVVAG